MKFGNFLWGLKEAYRTGIVRNLDEEDYLTKYLFARMFGWTPEQVDRLSYKDVIVLRKLVEIEQEENEYVMGRKEKVDLGL